MKTEKATEKLTELKQGLDLPLMTDYDQALSLGIEALKRLREGRKVDHAFAWKRLPGETKE